MRLLPQRLVPPMLRRSRDRGSAEIGVALVAAAVVAGSLVGTGVARTAVEVTDGVTWLADSPTGQVVEINPSTLEPQSAALVGLPGQQLVLSQDRGRLVVANRATGALTSIDLATLLASGRRDATPGDAVTVLLDHGRAFLVDRGVGLVASIDPVTLATRGRVWLAPKGLRDATIDGKGSMWVASGDDALTRLTWSEASLAFTSEETHALTRVGTTVRLVAHERGVTAVSPSTGAIVQVGTGHDLVSAAPQMRGPISPAQSSSSSLVPVSVPERDVVVIVRDGATVSEVRTAALGCPRPGAPVELHGVVYVPCPSTGRVIRLDGNGAKAGPDILTGKGAPELVVDDGALLVNVPGSTKGVKVSADGTTTSFVRFDETIKPADVDRDPAKDDKKAEEKAKKDREKDRDRPKKDPPRYDPGSGGLPTNTPDGPKPTHTSTRTTTPTPGGTGGSEEPPSAPTPAPKAPVITDARATGSGSASVTWTQPGAGASSYDVLVGGSVAVTVSGSTTSTTLTGLATGSTVQITVRGTYAGGRTVASAPAAVTPAGAPGAPGGVALSETARSRTSATFAVSWNAAGDNGSAVTRYAVSATGAHGSDTWSGSTRSASVTVPCDSGSASCGSVSVSVTATNAVGTGPAGTASAAVSPTPGLALPPAGATVVASQVSEGADDEFDYERVTTLTLTPPAGWASFGGVCSVRYTTAYTSGPATVPCSATSLQVTSTRLSEASRRSNHGVVIRAYDPATPGTYVESATFTWSLVWPIDVCGTGGKICP
ncbi:fibronectin type III domain-containing protein [Phycicoccus sonneratiae]|uniref:Fibronectin type-III domain-containing protein n=1 Tax=Phycicoccus sonneratiae TaxID=2807628 RepID=A0ABS2CS12_9MICO|nr:hypothetical protein [Phycicoccus sonneraticus]MBM6401951.1 hypothetical protein [Phycicoccus sonneraticus]